MVQKENNHSLQWTQALESQQWFVEGEATNV